MRRRILLVAVMASMALALFTPAAIAQDDDDGAAPYGTPSRTATATATTPLLRTRTTMITMGGHLCCQRGAAENWWSGSCCALDRCVVDRGRCRRWRSPEALP
jgi:hypothetical protein